MWPFSQPTWKNIASAKQNARNEAIRSTVASFPRGETSTDETEAYYAQYTGASAVQIVENISSGKWLATDVMQAYLHRASQVQELHNPITEVMFVEALEQARALDRDFQATGKIKGPLHGVPVSIKDQINIKGYDTTIGFSAWCNKPASKDAALVQMVKEAGGIIMYKTNVPQTLLNFECANPVWGVTSNPWNKGYTCGGSTGGEGVVLASDASALGIGTDVGGSLRIPALYCGVYSLKPAAGRVSRQGLGASNRGFNGIPITAGPMARTMDDLDLLSRLMFAYTPANDYEGIAPVPYRDPQLPSKLKIGYYFEDDWIRTSPANRRAVQETVDALKRAGHDLVPFDLPFGPKSIQMFAAITSGDGYKTLLSHRVNDPIEKNLFLIRLGPRLPRWFQLFAAWVIENILKDPLFAQTFRRSKISNLTEYWEDYAIIKDMNEEFYDRVWNKHKFDAIIAPGMAAPALPHGATTNLSPLANGTFYYNVIDSPVGAIPVTIVDPTRDKLTQEWWEGNGGYRGGSWILNNRLYGARREGGVYDVEKMKGLPVGIQVVGRHWEEEKVLAVMKIIDKALGPRGFGPGSWKLGSNAREEKAI